MNYLLNLAMSGLYGENERLQPKEPDDWKCPICGAVNPSEGYYIKGVFVGCEDCVEHRSCEDVPEYFKEV